MNIERDVVASDENQVTCVEALEIFANSDSDNSKAICVRSVGRVVVIEPFFSSPARDSSVEDCDLSIRVKLFLATLQVQLICDTKHEHI